jgi:hypothetical protein
MRSSVISLHPPNGNLTFKGRIVRHNARDGFLHLMFFGGNASGNYSGKFGSVTLATRFVAISVPYFVLGRVLKFLKFSLVWDID